ncbi:uncharacterized protein LOC125471511 [Pyrus x bretschneideri]|uniref:uncharacterized protein LOC125471511 n=1 Tax=Pyrus x bretschneideri TaxID=225117 RepID=UPI002030AAC6|nr:uncharacterized protein LOC125471511 [Pyrus x bretschneideri]
MSIWTDPRLPAILHLHRALPFCFRQSHRPTNQSPPKGLELQRKHSSLLPKNLGYLIGSFAYPVQWVFAWDFVDFAFVFGGREGLDGWACFCCVVVLSICLRSRPVYFVYLLRHYCWKGLVKGFWRLSVLGTVVVAVYTLAYGPFVYHGQVDMVIIPASTGHMGVLLGHVATIAELKPGVMSVHEGTDVTEHFFSGGFAFIHANSIAEIISVESVPLDHADASLVQKGLAEFTHKLNSASTDF